MSGRRLSVMARHAEHANDPALPHGRMIGKDAA